MQINKPTAALLKAAEGSISGSSCFLVVWYISASSRTQIKTVTEGYQGTNSACCVCKALCCLSRYLGLRSQSSVARWNTEELWDLWFLFSRVEVGTDAKSGQLRMGMALTYRSGQDCWGLFEVTWWKLPSVTTVWISHSPSKGWAESVVVQNWGLI